MKELVRPNGLHFKVGSLEWLNFFGLPLGLIGMGLISAYFYFQSTDTVKEEVFLFTFLLTLIVGIFGYWNQTRKLKFKVFKLSEDLESFRRSVRLLLLEKKWRIDYDNQQFLIASSKSQFYGCDMITIRFKKNTIGWNVIEHPHTYNSGAALFSRNSNGKKMMMAIKACA